MFYALAVIGFVCLYLMALSFCGSLLTVARGRDLAAWPVIAWAALVIVLPIFWIARCVGSFLHVTPTGDFATGIGTTLALVVVTAYVHTRRVGQLLRPHEVLAALERRD